MNHTRRVCFINIAEKNTKLYRWKDKTKKKTRRNKIPMNWIETSTRTEHNSTHNLSPRDNPLNPLGLGYQYGRANPKDNGGRNEACY